MDYFTDNAAPRAAITSFLINHAGDIPADARAKLLELGSSPSIVDLVVQVGEFIFARREDMPVEALVLGAQMAAYRVANDWHRDADTGNARGNAIQYALMRDATEEPPAGVTFADPADDPAPMASYAPAAAPAPAGS